MSSKVTGTQGLLKKLGGMKQLPPKEVSKLVKGGAGVILGAAKRNCQSQTVRDSLGFVTKNDSKFPYTALIGVIGGNKVGTKTITAPALAVINEFGTSERFKDNGASTGYFRPRPFMRPALDTNKDKVRSTITVGLEKIIQQQAKKNNLI